MKPPKITESEWKAELDRLREKRMPEFSEEVYKYIDYARTGGNPVMWGDVAAGLKKHFNITGNVKSIQYRYENWKKR